MNAGIFSTATTTKAIISNVHVIRCMQTSHINFKMNRIIRRCCHRTPSSNFTKHGILSEAERQDIIYVGQTHTLPTINIRYLADSDRYIQVKHLTEKRYFLFSLAACRFQMLLLVLVLS